MPEDISAELVVSREDNIIGIRKECKVHFANNTKEHSIWLYFFKNLNKVSEEEKKYYESIKDIKEAIINRKVLYKDLTSSNKTRLKNCYDLSEDADGYAQIRMNQDKVKNFNNTLGIYVLVSTDKKEPNEINELYRMRNEIEACFGILKTDMDGGNSRSGVKARIKGLELCRLLAVGYKLKFIQIVNKIKAICNTVSNDMDEKAATRNEHKELLKWMNKNNSVRILLNYLMATEKTVIENNGETFVLESEVISKLKLFIKLFDEELERMHGKS